MSNSNIADFSLRIDRDLLDRISFIADYKGRSANRQIIQLIINCIHEFEKENGKISSAEIEDFKERKKNSSK